MTKQAIFDKIAVDLFEVVKMIDKKKKIFGYIVIIGISILLALPSWVARHFGEMNFDQVVFLWFSDGQGSAIDIAMIFAFIMFMGPLVIIISILYWLYIKRIETNPFYTTKFIKKGKVIPLKYEITRKRVLTGLLVVAILVFVGFDRKVHIIDFFMGNQDVSRLYENYYLDPVDAHIKFPEKKQNLIYIILESMETTFDDVSINEEDVSLIPDLKAISEENISFSNKKTFGGGKQIKGASWTAASLVGQTSGVPIQISKIGTTFGGEQGFLNGIKTLGELLEEQGYSNYFLAGSDAKFGGREEYFKRHGNYNIRDTKYYKEIGKIDPDYNVFWGFEDLKLFEFAKEELTEISKKDEPFNFTMLTVDTHFTDGYVDETCELKYEDQYPNAILCSNNKIAEFIKWIQAQDFYEDTTIIMTGDHYTMNNVFAKTFNTEERSTYNAIINPNLKNIDEQRLKKRDFTVLDFFPTTLAALGVEIEENKLGLGVNLFSEEQTILEILGAEELDIQIGKRSNYYNNKFFGDLDE